MQVICSLKGNQNNVLITEDVLPRKALELYDKKIHPRANVIEKSFERTAIFKYKCFPLLIWKRDYCSTFSDTGSSAKNAGYTDNPVIVNLQGNPRSLTTELVPCFPRVLTL